MFYFFQPHILCVLPCNTCVWHQMCLNGGCEQAVESHLYALQSTVEVANKEDRH